jgi:predicted  nucleic acid-binding Zn-ribbon protein
MTCRFMKLGGLAPLLEHFMALFSGRASMLEVQNRALIKTARERAERIDKLERELQTARERAKRFDKLEPQLQAAGESIERIDKLERELQQAGQEVERLKVEREFYYKRVLALEQHNHELTEAATKYSLWGQRLERELARIDPDGAPARQFGAGHDA